MFLRARFLGLALFCLGLVLLSYKRQGEAVVLTAALPDSLAVKTARRAISKPASKSLVLARPDSLPMLFVDEALQQALFWQDTYLRRHSTPKNSITGFQKKLPQDHYR